MQQIATRLRDIGVELGQELARGRQAVVHEATFDGAEVVVKLAPEHLVARECRALQACAATDVVSVIDKVAAEAPEPDSLAALVLQRIDGAPLDAYILGDARRDEETMARPRRNLPIAFGYAQQDEGTSLYSSPGAAAYERALRLAPRLLGILRTLHARGVLHLDIAPDNLLVTSDGFPTLIDFGHARFMGEDLEGEEQESEIGRPEYMAPELALGRLSEAADLYSMGVALFVSIAGAAPFPGGGQDAMMRKAHMRPPRLDEELRDAPAQLAELVDALLDPSPTARMRRLAETRLP